MKHLLPLAALLLLVTTACSGPRRGYRASDSTEDVLVMLGAAEMNSSFKFYDAADGCPSYGDVGNKKYMGMVKAKEKGATFPFPIGAPVHVIFFRPKETHLLLAEGGPKGALQGFRKHAAQVTVTGKGATLTATRGDDGMEWTFTGPVTVEPGTACED
jgi:hypothetical protein